MTLTALLLPLLPLLAAATMVRLPSSGHQGDRLDLEEGLPEGWTKTGMDLVNTSDSSESLRLELPPGQGVVAVAQVRSMTGRGWGSLGRRLRVRAYMQVWGKDGSSVISTCTGQRRVQDLRLWILRHSSSGLVW